MIRGSVLRAIAEKSANHQKAAIAANHIDKCNVVTTGDDTSPKTSKMSFNEQVEALKKLKELTDAGILTQEEFELKKKEIMEL